MKNQETNTERSVVNRGLAQMLKGGVIMDVVNAEHARIAEQAGAVAVMALERIPSDIRAKGGVARMSPPELIREIMETVSIPVMAKCRIGHFAEAMVLQALDVDFIDESEVLTPADEQYHIWKNRFEIPFVCGACDLGEALRRISEGASMIRTKGEAGTGNIVEAVRHMRTITEEIRQLSTLSDKEIEEVSEVYRVDEKWVREVRTLGRLPVVNFAAGGIATPADAMLMMHLGVDGVFVGSGIFKSSDPARLAEAIVQTVTHYQDAKQVAAFSEGLGEAMPGLDVYELYASRGD